MEDNNIVLSRFVRSLLKNTHSETELIEFKSNIYDAEKLGRTISAMANSAALANKQMAYIIFGIEDETLKFVGTDFDPYTFLTKSKKDGVKTNQLLLPWLGNTINPKLSLKFYPFQYIPDEGEDPASAVSLVILEIPAASRMPVSFQRIRYIRIGASVAALENYPETEGRLWEILNKNSFLYRIAKNHLTSDQIFDFLDVQSYIRGRRLPPLIKVDEILKRMEQERLIESSVGMYCITNLGALLYAFDLTSFEGLENRIIRVARYNGKSRTAGCIEERFAKGYAVEFSELLGRLMAAIPNGEVLQSGGVRQMYTAVPETAVREILANCMIHQDMQSKNSTLISIFANRIEFVSPGAPSIDVRRFMDSFDASRNEQLALFMNRLGLCEGRGEGIDNAVSSVEEVHSIAPLIDSLTDATRVVLPFNRPFEEMSSAERLACCLSHCTLRFLEGKPMTNASLRERFGLPENKTQNISVLIRSAVKQGLIKPLTEGAAKKSRSYIPFWASLAGDYGSKA